MTLFFQNIFTVSSNQEIDCFWIKFQVGLKGIMFRTKADNLTWTPLTSRKNNSIFCQSWHITMPVTGFKNCSKLTDMWICESFRRQGHRINPNLTFRTVVILRPIGNRQELGTKTDSNNITISLDGFLNQLDLCLRIVVWKSFPIFIWRLRTSHDD